MCYGLKHTNIWFSASEMKSGEGNDSTQKSITILDKCLRANKNSWTFYSALCSQAGRVFVQDLNEQGTH